MKKIEPVRNYAVFITAKDTKNKNSDELKKEFIQIMREQIVKNS